MENKQITVNKGGRPAKKEHERATIKLNCWVTPTENSALQAEYMQVKAGRKLLFAQFLKQVLLVKKKTSGPKSDELLLTILINLQDQSRRLETISHLLGEKQELEKEIGISDMIGIELAKIRETITQITTWLYES